MQKFERMYQTLWFMQAHLKDLALAHHGSESFLICQRVLNQCHEMIYADLPASTTPYSTLNIPKIPGFLRKKVKSHVPPAFIGISMILAGVPAMPSLTEVMGEVAIEQGRLDDQGDDLRSLENLDGIVRPQADHTSDLPDEKDDGNESEEEPQSNPPDVDRPPLSAARLGGKRAPYLLLIEILHGDLDFDPAKRGNKEILKKIVVKENERKGASQDLINFNGAPSAIASASNRYSTQSTSNRDPVERNLVLDTNNIDENDSQDVGQSLAISISPTPTTPLDEEEEIDLVEQLYGAENSLRSRSIDISESIVLPPAPKNRELDMAAWSRSSSMLPSPIVENEMSKRIPAPDLSRSTSGQGSQTPNTTRVLSLDEYSERMRTAAVMLAQLNANLLANYNSSCERYHRRWYGFGISVNEFAIATEAADCRSRGYS
ncbi:hypothetical protein EW026_g2636 [Hermanssonia centrifuga]|uniref:Uncharacterized protein n=1 Tax=Hermanssonia centrifuga TaxID=98765 RepID=A0A4S4KML5_9APHY|nr:hypothetical protein EW026_g2636 [Hermanssonia centrifuga]